MKVKLEWLCAASFVAGIAFSYLMGTIFRGRAGRALYRSACSFAEEEEMTFELISPPDRKPIRVARTHSTQRDNVRGKHSDHFQTPPEAIEYLLPFIDPKSHIWDPACGKNNIVEAFRSRGYCASGTDILTGDDFLGVDHSYPYKNRILITNPPYSLKDAWIERSYELGEPFALLMPLTALEGKRRQKAYRLHGLQLMVLPKRMDFETPNLGKNVGGAWFSTAWF